MLQTRLTRQQRIDCLRGCIELLSEAEGELNGLIFEISDLAHTKKDALNFALRLKAVKEKIKEVKGE